MLRRILPNLLLVCISLGVGYVLFEIGVRLYMQHKYLDGNYQISATYVAPDPEEPSSTEPVIGWEKPNRTLYYYIFDKDSNVVFYSKYHSNNVGLISLKNYFLQRSGEKQYRIAILGDSFTASLQMSNPWPDRLEDLLKQDTALKAKLGVETFHVYNFGVFSAGFDDFFRQAQKARDFDPDMVIVNFIGADFTRCNSCLIIADNPYKVEARHLISGTVPLRVGPEADSVAELSMSCEKPPVSFSNPTCRHSFQLSIPPHLALDKGKVNEIKRIAVREYLRGQLWRSLYPYGLMLAMGRPVDLHHLRNPELYRSNARPKTMTDQEQVDSALRYLQEIRGLYPGKPVLVIQNPTMGELDEQPDEAKTRALMAKEPSLQVTLMRKRLPSGTSREEMHSWFCEPYDGHMSDAGGAVYAAAVRDLLREKLMP